MSATSPAQQGPRHPAPLGCTATGTRLWLVRHGEVDEAWQGKAYGNLDVPLGPDGIEQSHKLGRDLARLGPRSVSSSPLQRALNLAVEIQSAAAGDNSIEVVVESGLAEIDRGSWQGLAAERIMQDHAEAVAAYYRDPWAFREHGGETDRDILERAAPALKRCVARASGGVAIITAHYNVIRVLAAAAMAIPPAQSFALRIDTAHALCLRDDESWHLLTSNAESPPCDPLFTEWS